MEIIDDILLCLAPILVVLFLTFRIPKLSHWRIGIFSFSIWIIIVGMIWNQTGLWSGGAELAFNLAALIVIFGPLLSFVVWILRKLFHTWVTPLNHIPESNLPDVGNLIDDVTED